MEAIESSRGGAREEGAGSGERGAGSGEWGVGSGHAHTPHPSGHSLPLGLSVTHTPPPGPLPHPGIVMPGCSFFFITASAIFMKNCAISDSDKLIFFPCS